MQTKISIVVTLSLFLATACSTGHTTEASAPQNPANPPVTETSLPDSPIPIVETTLPEVIQITTAGSTETPATGGNPIPEGGITLEDRGKTFTMQVGDSFLLNLGMDIYNWAVTVDNENVLRRELNVAVIRAAQGTYQALAPGTVTLSASGDPLCLKSNPPCALPSILFTVTVVVE
jgi:hypothetical protein